MAEHIDAVPGDYPPSLENLVADFSIDGGQMPDLSYQQIQDLRGSIGTLATQLVEVGLDVDGILRLHELGREYGIFKQLGRVNFIGVNSLGNPNDIDTDSSDVNYGEVYSPSIATTTTEALSGCAKELRRLKTDQLFDYQTVFERYGFIETPVDQEGNYPRDKNICAKCPVPRELKECDIKRQFGEIATVQLQRSRQVKLQTDSNGGSRGHGAFLQVWRDYHGDLGGGTPKNALQVPGIVHH